MPALHVRNVDDAVIKELKARAARNHRSLEGEVRSILEAAVGRKPSAGATPRRRLRLRTVSIDNPVVYSRDVIYEDDDR